MADLIKRNAEALYRILAEWASQWQHNVSETIGSDNGLTDIRQSYQANTAAQIVRPFMIANGVPTENLDAAIDTLRPDHLEKAMIDLLSILRLIGHEEDAEINPYSVTTNDRKTVQLTPRQKSILSVLSKLKPDRGLEGKEIVEKLPKNIRKSESTLRRHDFPILIKSGLIQNTPGIGYRLVPQAH